MTLKQIYKEVSKSTGIPVKEVEETYKSYWKAVKEYISSLDFHQDLTEEEFKEMRPHINIPYLGRLVVFYARYNQIIKNKKNKDATHQEG